MTDFFFALLRSGLYGTAVAESEIPDKVDWPEIIKFAQKQTVLGIVADAVFRLPKPEIVPEKVREKLQSFVKRNILTHQLLNTTLAEVVTELDKAGVASVLLKGQGVARNYPTPELRQCGDIDLYVGRSAYDKACEIGVRLHQDEKTPYESGKHFSCTRHGVSIELHHKAAEMFTPSREKTMQRWFDSQLNDSSRLVSADFCGVRVQLPSATFNAFFLFFHLVHHYMYQGVGLRQFCDWALVLHNHHGEIDADDIEKILHDLKLTKSWQVMGCLLVDYLGLPKSEFPMYNAAMTAQAAKVMDTILKEGNFGNYKKKLVKNHYQLPYFLRKTVSVMEFPRRWGRQWAFSPSETISYTFYFLYVGTRAVIKDIFKQRR